MNRLHRDSPSLKEEKISMQIFIGHGKLSGKLGMTSEVGSHDTR